MFIQLIKELNMNKLEDIIKRDEYKNLIVKHFDKLGFELIDNEKQLEQFNKDFIEYQLDINDKEHFLIHQILNKTHWFCKTEEDEYFGLYKHPIINEYTCIIQLDNEWGFEWMGADCQLWAEAFFDQKLNRYIDIPKTVEEFKNETELLNQDINIYPEISDEDILSLYDIFFL